MIWTAESGLKTDQLSADDYAAWVDFSEPETGESRGTIRTNSVRFVEKNINVDKSLSLAAAVNPRIEAALNNAQRKAAEAMTSYVAEHARTRVGPAGAQCQVPVEHIETVTHAHAVSRENEPHPHIHWQVGARVYAEGKWRQLDTADFAKHSAALNALGEQAIHADRDLQWVLALEGYRFDPATGKVAELDPYVDSFSTRAAQIRRNKELLEANWKADPANAGKVPGPAVRSEWDHMAWNGTAELAHIDAELTPRPAKETAEGDLKQRWRQELAAEREALVSAVVHHDQARSIADPRTVPPETARHWTAESVIETEDELKQSLAARAAVPTDEQKIAEATALAKELDPQLSEDQARAAALLGTGSRLTVIEGAAGAGKTKQLKAASTLRGDRPMLTVTPTLKAAQEARHAGADACSLHKLLHAHGFRWDEDNQWTRLAPDETDPATGQVFIPPTPGDEFYLHPDTQIVVDEAGMVDQEAARALMRLADAHRSDVALIGDRAQLAAVGRGGVLDMAARATTEHVDLDQVHRFHDPEYAELSLKLRERREIPETFDRLHARGDVKIHATAEEARKALAADAVADIQAGKNIALTVPTNDAAKRLNEAIQAERAFAGDLDMSSPSTTGSDELSIHAGDTVMTRSNNKELGVANRESFRVVNVHSDGALTVAGEDSRHHRLDAEYVAENVHLGYAVTDYGNQGTTVDSGALLADDGLSGGGAYVGLTRGRESNTLHIVAEDTDAAREKLAQIMETDQADRGLDQARRNFAEQTKGLQLHPTPPQHPNFKHWAEPLPKTIQEAAQEVRKHRRAKNWPKRDAAFREKYGTDPASARIKANGARHHREQAQKAVEETGNRIMHEHEQQVGAPVYSAVDKLRATEAEAREAGMFTRGAKTRQAQQARAEVEAQLQLGRPGRIRRRSSLRTSLRLIRRFVLDAFDPADQDRPQAGEGHRDDQPGNDQRGEHRVRGEPLRARAQREQDQQGSDAHHIHRHQRGHQIAAQQQPDGTGHGHDAAQQQIPERSPLHHCAPCGFSRVRYITKSPTEMPSVSMISTVRISAAAHSGCQLNQASPISGSASSGPSSPARMNTMTPATSSGRTHGSTRAREG